MGRNYVKEQNKTGHVREWYPEGGKQAIVGWRSKNIYDSAEVLKVAPAAAQVAAPQNARAGKPKLFHGHVTNLSRTIHSLSGSLTCLSYQGWW